MAYGLKYQIHFSSLLTEEYLINMEVNGFTGPVTTLICKDVQLRCVNGDENRFENIIGKECLISFDVRNNSALTIANFLANIDSSIRVTVIYVHADGSTSTVFQGFVVVEDNSQPFHDQPYIIQVRALDGLGLLKGVDLVDTNNIKFTGSMSVIQWIAQILYKTNQTLPVRVFFNFFYNGSNELNGSLEQIFLSSTAFSEGDSFNVNSADPSIDTNALTADDCYTALEKIMRCFRCKIFMEDGNWNIVNLYEWMNPDGYSYVSYVMGAPTAGIVPVSMEDKQYNQNFDSNVGKKRIIHPVQADQNLFLKVSTKWIRLEYDYNQAANKICNQALTEGYINNSLAEVISSTVIDPTITPTANLNTVGYDDGLGTTPAGPYCFTHFNGPAGSSGWLTSPNPPTDNAFIRSVLDTLGFEFQRFLVIKGVGTSTFVRTSPVLVDAGDRVEISFDFRTRNSMAAAVFQVAYVFFYGDDGSHWLLTALETNGTSTATQWVSVNSDFVPLDSVKWDYTVAGVPTTTWQTVTAGGITPIQVPGQGHIIILMGGLVVGTGNEFWFRNINFKVYPYLNGGYQEIKGDYNYSSIDPTITVKNSENDKVQISDSPKRYFKGALLLPDGSSLIAPDWHRRGKTESMRFTAMMERILWNLQKRQIYKVEGTFKGVWYQDSDLAYHPMGILNTYYFEDWDQPTKKFMMTSFDLSLATGNGRRVFVEMVQDVNSDSFIDPRTSPNIYKFAFIF